jgi:putative ABC transport system permease protein
MTFAPRVHDERRRSGRHRPWCSRPAASPTALPWPAKLRTCAQFCHAGPSSTCSAQACAACGVESLESGSPADDANAGAWRRNSCSLVALLAALLCAVAVALAARGFAAGHHGWHLRMLRVLGLRQRAHRRAAYAVGILCWWAWPPAWPGLAAGLWRCTMCSCCPAGRFGAKVGLPRAQGCGRCGAGPGPGPDAAVLPSACRQCCKLAQVPPLRVHAPRHWGRCARPRWPCWGLGVAGFAALLLAVSSDLRLGLIAVGGLWCGGVLLFAAAELAGTCMRCARSVNAATKRRAGWCWPHASSRRARPMPWCKSAAWRWACWRWCCWYCCAPTSDCQLARRPRPPDAPNRFVINILPDQAEPLSQTLATLRACSATTGTPCSVAAWWPSTTGPSPPQRLHR